MRRQVRSLAVASVLAFASPASAISFDLSGGGDFGPTGTQENELSATGGGLTLMLTASSLIPEAEPALGGELGVVFIDTLGAGVRAGVGQGSKEISGGGGHRDEALNFAWSMPVVTSSLTLTLTQFNGSDSKKNGKSKRKTKTKTKIKTKSKQKSSKKKGDAAVVYIDDPIQPLLTEAMVLCLLDPITGERDTFFLNLADDAALNLCEAPGLPSTFSSLSIRATNGHFLVSQIAAVPEPASLALVGAGLVGMVCALKRGRARGSAAPRHTAITR